MRNGAICSACNTNIQEKQEKGHVDINVWYRGHAEIDINATCLVKLNLRMQGGYGSSASPSRISIMATERFYIY